MSQSIRIVCLLVLLLGCTTPDPSPEPSVYDPDKSYTENCLTFYDGSEVPTPNYEQFDPLFGDHCAGTRHQDIQDIGHLLFIGDSVTTGTPPTEEWNYYANLLSFELMQRTPELKVKNCAEWGARTDDLIDKQLIRCAPDPLLEPTLIVMTIGGNDMFVAAQKLLNGESLEQANAVVDRSIRLFEEAITWIRNEASTRFPAGVDIVFANVYEFTDATGDLASCPSAELLGFNGSVPEMKEAYVYAAEQYMRVAVETQSDMIMLMESFCGHGFNADNVESPCYRGPDANNWFDGTCIHPNPQGHQEIAQLFQKLILP